MERRQAQYVSPDGPQKLSSGSPFAAWWLAFVILLFIGNSDADLGLDWFPWVNALLVTGMITAILFEWRRFSIGSADRVELSSYSIRFLNGDKVWLELSYQDAVDSINYDDDSVAIGLQNENTRGASGSIILKRSHLVPGQWDSFVRSLKAKQEEARQILTPKTFPQPAV